MANYKAEMRLVLRKIVENGKDPFDGAEEITPTRIDITVSGPDMAAVERTRVRLSQFFGWDIGSGDWAGPGSGETREIE